MNSYSKHFFDDSDDIEIRSGTDSFHSIRIGCCVRVTADDLGQLYRLYSRLDSYLAGTEERDLDENAQADAYENASGHKEVEAMNDENPLIGKKVVSVYKASDSKALRFDTEDGETLIARAEGGCCSSTWIESLDAPELLLGRVRSVESLGMPRVEEDGKIKHYGCQIITTEGRCVIDYRNKSNGYYGGNIRWPHERHYRGTYGQNESNEDWRLVADD